MESASGLLRPGGRIIEEKARGLPRLLHGVVEHGPRLISRAACRDARAACFFRARTFHSASPGCMPRAHLGDGALHATACSVPSEIRDRRISKPASPSMRCKSSAVVTSSP